jgi:hypothetical protein
MPDTKISDLTAASALTGTEEIPLSDGTSTTKAATAAQFKTYAHTYPTTQQETLGTYPGFFWRQYYDVTWSPPSASTDLMFTTIDRLNFVGAGGDISLPGHVGGHISWLNVDAPGRTLGLGIAEEAKIDVAAGNITAAVGVETQLATNAGAITSWLGVQARITGNAGSIVAAVPFYADISANAGTISAYYGFFQADLTGISGITAKYAFYNNDPAAEVYTKAPLWIDERSSVPSLPAAGLKLYTRSRGGRRLLTMVGPAGVDTPLQPAIFSNRAVYFAPQSGTTGTGGAAFNVAWTSNGTVSHPAPSSAAPAVSNQMKRTRYANVVTTTNQQLGPRFNTSSEQMFWRGNAAGLGGFFFNTRFIVELIPASTIRLFAGLVGSSNGSVAISDTVLNNTCGLWHDTTDPLSGANSFNFVTRNTVTTTKQSIALANAIAAGNSYDFTMFCAPNGGEIFWRLYDIVNNVEYTGSTTSTLPANTAFMHPQVQMSNGTANITVTTVALGIVSIYCESDR